MEPLELLGNAIRNARMQRGLSQEYLAEMFDVTPTHIRHIESGHRKPSIELLFQLAKRLDISLDALIFQDKPVTPVIHTDGLTPEEIGTLSHLADLLRDKKGPHCSDSVMK